jgi:hypothetical protein
VSPLAAEDEPVIELTAESKFPIIPVTPPGLVLVGLLAEELLVLLCILCILEEDAPMFAPPLTFISIDTTAYI